MTLQDPVLAVGGLHYLAGFGQELSAGRRESEMDVACRATRRHVNAVHSVGRSAVKSHMNEAFTIRTDLYGTAAVQT